MSGFELLDHPSDLRVRAQGRDRRDLFETAAQATFELMARPRSRWPQRDERIAFDVAAAAPAELLRRLLAECVFLFETRGFLARRVEVALLTESRCAGAVQGARFAAEELDVLHVIKAVTWHGLRLDEAPGLCTAEVLYDL